MPSNTTRADADTGAGATLVIALSGTANADDLHGTLARDLRDWSVSRLASLGCGGFVLSQRVPDPDIDGFGENRGWAPAPDALIQFAFDDAGHARHALSFGTELLPRSARTLVEPAASSLFIAREAAVFAELSEEDRWRPVPAGQPPVKMIVQNWKRPDLSFASYTEHWRNVHARLVREHGPAMGFRRYVQSHRADAGNDDGMPPGWGPSPDGGMTEVWWTSHAAMKRALGTAEAQAASALFADDEKNFVHPPRMSAMLARETRVVFAGGARGRG